jgi:hypothetical protein
VCVLCVSSLSLLSLLCVCVCVVCGVNEKLKKFNMKKNGGNDERDLL